MEHILAHIARFIDPNMLYIHNLEYQSIHTILFQRISVVATDILLYIAVKYYTKHSTNTHKTLAVFITAFNPALIMVDSKYLPLKSILLTYQQMYTFSTTDCC
jgi:alpha-1,3-glucosyltransferase